jgi:hypothetical protein
VVTDDIKARYTRAILISLSTTGLDKKALDTLKERLLEHPGKVPVYLNFVQPDGKSTRVSIGNNFNVIIDDGLVGEIEELVGKGAVSLKVGNGA